jgi:hypothetical protein
VGLRRRLSGVADIAISQSQQTVSVQFDPPAARFSAATVRQAVGDASAEVLRLDVVACGHVEDRAGERWLVAGEAAYVLTGAAAAAGTAVCVAGRLDDAADPQRLESTRVDIIQP